MKRPSALLVLALFTLCCALPAQTFDLKAGRVPMTSLDGLWRFQPGDDPAWARPDFDDSKWPLIRSDESWSDQGYLSRNAMAWYRFQVSIPAGIDHLSLYLPYILTSYQVYADGQLIGSYGKMPPHAVPYWGGGWFQTYSLPHRADKDETITVALRIWHWPAWASYFGGGPSNGGGLVGDTALIENRDALSQGAHHWNLSSTMILALLQTLAGIGALVLFVLRRSDREYLWFGLMMLASAVAGWLALSFAFTPWNQLISDPLQDVVPLVAVALAEAAFYFYLLRGRRSLLLIAALSGILLTLAYLAVKSFGIFDPAFQTGLSLTTVNLLESLLHLPLDIWILALLFSRARRNLFDARLLLAPVLLQKLAQITQSGAIVTYNLGWQSVFGYDIVIIPRPFPIELLQVADALFLIAILAILIHRFTRTLSQGERYATELDAARSVQQVLIPQECPQPPGLAIESEYIPAREVGGDFFQILPQAEDGSVLIVVGDVAGKGLQAGMLATLVVGSIRMAATFTVDPQRVITLLNERLQGRGLVTCLALRLETDGHATLANAGHLAPYLNAIELPMEGALPLGAVAGIEFPVLHFELNPGDRLMLMSDGIVEAQDDRGQLFGFDRLGELLRQPCTAASLAAAAQAFGQEDDITVLTVTRTAPAPVGA